MPRIEDERIEEVDDPNATSTESFDRIAFAERALALVRPRATQVAICQGSRRVRVEAGRQWGRGEDARWAILSIPADASRRAIANAVLGLVRGEAKPWALDVLVHVCDGPDDSGGPYR